MVVGWVIGLKAGYLYRPYRVGSTVGPFYY